MLSKVTSIVEPSIDFVVNKIDDYRQKKSIENQINTAEVKKQQQIMLKNKILMISCDKDKRAYVPIEDLPIQPVYKFWLSVKDVHNRFVCKPTSVD